MRRLSWSQGKGWGLRFRYRFPEARSLTGVDLSPHFLAVARVTQRRRGVPAFVVPGFSFRVQVQVHLLLHFLAVARVTQRCRGVPAFVVPGFRFRVQGQVHLSPQFLAVARVTQRRRGELAFAVTG